VSDIKKAIRFVILGEDKGATKALQGVGKGFRGAVHDAEGFGGKAKVAAGALAGIGVAAVAAAGAIAVKFGKDSIDTFKRVGGQVRTLARITGLSAEQASRLNFAFKETGVSSESGAKGMKTLEKNLQAATSTGKKTTAMASQLGFKFTDAHGAVLPMAQLLPKLADRFSHMKDGPEKTALAMKLLGKAGVDMIPMLNQGSAGLAKLGKESDKTGNTLSGKQLDALKANKKAQKEWDAAMQGLQVTLGSALLPILTKGAEFLNSTFVPAIENVTQWIHNNQAGFDALGHMMTWVWNNILLPLIKLAIVGYAKMGEAIGWVIAGIGKLTGNKDMENFGNMILKTSQDTEDWVNNLKGIPDQIAPTVDVKATRAKAELSVVHKQLASLKDRLVTAKAKGDTKQVDALRKSIAALKNKEITIKTNLAKGKGVTYNAKLSVDGTGAGKWTLRRRGGYTPPGWTVVGEDGPELRYFSRTSSIVSNARARQIMSGPASSGPGLTYGSSGGDVYNFHFAGVLTEAQAGAVFEKALNKLKLSRRGRKLAFQ